MVKSFVVRTLRFAAMRDEMAPNLDAAQRQLLGTMVQSSGMLDSEIASNAGCTTRSVRAAQSNLKSFGSTTAPHNGCGRQSTITPPMLAALLHHFRNVPLGGEEAPARLPMPLLLPRTWFSRSLDLLVHCCHPVACLEALVPLAISRPPPDDRCCFVQQPPSLFTISSSTY